MAGPSIPVTLVHNPRAGLRPTPPQSLSRALRRAGLMPRYLPTTTRPNLARALRGARHVVAAGGDGTVAKVLRATADFEMRIGIVPTGTANNIAMTFGIPADQHSAIENLRSGEPRPMDLATVRTAEGRHTLVESLGIGVLAATAAATPNHNNGSPQKESKFADARRLLADALAVAQPVPGLSIDGRDLSGRVLFLEILNIPLTGPNLGLAPSALPDDGLLDLVYATAAERGDLIDWLRAGAGAAALPWLPAVQAPRFRIAWSGAAIRIDDDFPAMTEGRVAVVVRANRARILAPSSTTRPRPIGA